MRQLKMMEIETVAIMEIHPVGKATGIGGMKIKPTVHVVRDQAIGNAAVVTTILHRVTNVKNATKLNQKVLVVQTVNREQKYSTSLKKSEMMICLPQAFQRVLISIGTIKYQLMLSIQPEIAYRHPLHHSRHQA